MNKLKNISIIGLLLLVLFTACEDFLYQEPKLAQTNELTLSTYNGIDKAVAAAYSVLYDDFWYGRDFVVTADIKGGNAKLSPISSGRFTTEYLWNNLPDASSGLWRIAYMSIARANNALNALEELDEVGITEDQINQLKGESLFLRALSHFDLVRMFAQPYAYDPTGPGVPIIFVSEIGSPARNTVADVYDQVIADLKEAEKLLGPAAKRTGTDPKAYASTHAAQALLARVYLYKEEWQNAADYATKVIESGAFSLTPAESYTTIENGGIWGANLGGAETIFEVFGVEGNQYSANWDVLPYILSPEGYGDVGASMDLINLYEEGDVRAELFTNTADYPNDFWSIKYPGKEGSNFREDNIQVLRLAEMYLIRAEAILKGANVPGTSAANDISEIRINRGLDKVTTISLAEVYNERRRELCFEGHQLFDLARTQRSLERVDYEGAVNQNIPFPNYMWAMPIPKSEIDANPNMEQNEGYN